MRRWLRSWRDYQRTRVSYVFYDRDWEFLKAKVTGIWHLASTCVSVLLIEKREVIILN